MPHTENKGFLIFCDNQLELCRTVLHGDEIVAVPQGQRERETAVLFAVGCDAVDADGVGRVGRADERFGKVRHPVKMGSLTDVFSFDELRAFVDKTRQQLLSAGETEVLPSPDAIGLVDIVLSPT